MMVFQFSLPDFISYKPLNATLEIKNHCSDSKKYDKNDGIPICSY